MWDVNGKKIILDIYTDMDWTGLNSKTPWRQIHNIMSQRCSIGFRSGERGSQSVVSIPSSSRNCLHSMSGIVVHQEESRTHCDSVGSEKDWQSECHCPSCIGLCVTPWISLPKSLMLNNVTEYNVLHSFSRPFHVFPHVLRVNLLLSVKGTGR